jgi:DNA-binding XRE family transcriptional regulator
MHTVPFQSFGALLRHARLAAGLTQEALAERAGISADAISTLERGALPIQRLSSGWPRRSSSLWRS